VVSCSRRSRVFDLEHHMRDDELPAAVGVVLATAEHRPDAAIVRDVGLARMLRQQAPWLTLHFSTQSGIHTIDDLHWLASEGVSRAILARELSEDEIATLTAATEVETEVFVAGSACICVSGSCDLGGLLTGGSGDRGRCIGICRHRYVVDQQQGQWLYARILTLLVP